MILLGILSYLAGLWVGPFLFNFPFSICIALLGFGLFLTWSERRKQLPGQTGLLLFACVVGGIAHAHWATIAPVHSDLLFHTQGQALQLEGVIVAPVRQNPDGLVLLVEAHRLVRGKETVLIEGRIRLTWRDSGNIPLRYGDTVIFNARVREPYGTVNPGGFQYGDYLRRQGIHAVGTVQGPDAVKVKPPHDQNIFTHLLGGVDQWRQTIHTAAVRSLVNPALGLFLGMVLGEQSYIEQEIRDAFMASGTVHILSISGSHLGLLAVFMFAGAKWTFRLLPPSWLERVTLRLTATRFAILITLPAVSFYTVLAGAEIATVRSWIMIVVCCAGIWLGRERNLLTALAVAALLMVLPHPNAIQDISFQLSYFSVGAIALVLVTRKGQERHAPDVDTILPATPPNRIVALWRKISLAWIMSVAVTLTTLPLIAYHFHQLPWLGTFTNMIIVPLVGMVMIPISLSSGIATLMGNGEMLPLASVNQWIFDFLAQLVLAVSHIPKSSWYVASPNLSAMILFWGLLAGVLFMGQKSILRWGCITLSVAIILWWAWSPRTGWEPGTLRVTFLDVGQGDATLLELPDGQTVLIDAGPAYRRLDMGRAVIGPYLWNRGIRRLDHIVATHPQWDHVGGLPWIVSTFEVGNYWSNGVRRSEEFFKRLQIAVDLAGVKERAIFQGTNILDGGPCLLMVLSPSFTSFISTTVSSGKDLNNRSLVTRLECGMHSFLFTADAEQEALLGLLRNSDGVSARVVKIPHHGAKSSLQHEWVNRLQTEAMVVSVGSHNRYGHPAAEVMNAYLHRGFPIYRTDWDGAIWVTASLDSGIMRISTARQERLQTVRLGKQMWKQEKANWIRVWRR